jgi:carboxyl-terminal processing protease
MLRNRVHSSDRSRHQCGTSCWAWQAQRRFSSRGQIDRRACLAGLAALAFPARAGKEFNAAPAWAEFVDLLTTRYGYFERPGIDGPAILAAFDARARTAPDAAALRRIMRHATRNFADPHLLAGPLEPDDPAVIPTASDLAAAFTGNGAEVVDVRQESAAEAAAVVPGTRIRAVDGLAPEAAVAGLLGRAFASLMEAQRDFGLELALAGRRGSGGRALSIEAAEGRYREVQLAPTRAQADRVAALPPLETRRAGSTAIIRIHNSLGRAETIAAIDAAVAASIAVPRLVIDLRNTPSGGNTTVARAILGHFTDTARPYQVHEVPWEARVYGVPRRFIEQVLPRPPFYSGEVIALGGRWTGSMGEGLMIGFDALGHQTVGSRMGQLLGALFAEDLPLSGARVEFGGETLFHVDGRAREAFLPRVRADPADFRDGALAAALALPAGSALG